MHTKFDREGVPLEITFASIFRKYKIDRFWIMTRHATFYTVFDSEEGYENFAKYANGKEHLKIWLSKGRSNV